MRDSLLVALRNYRVRPSRDSLEDYITTAFAWTLQNEPAVGSAFLEAVYQKASISPSTGDITWQTHVSLETEEGRGEADMVAYHGEQGVLFEHKTYSPATAAQVDRYRRALKPAVKATVLITASRWNYNGSEDDDVLPPDIHWTWGDVYTILQEAADGLSDRSRVDDFLALLKSEGLGPTEALSEPSIRAFAASQHVLEEMFALVDAVRTESDWSFVYDALPPLEEPPRQRERWTSVGTLFNGRIPFDLFHPWRPGLRVGIIVDPSNIRTSLVDQTLGPDLAVYLGIPKGDLSSSDHQRVMHSDAMNNLGNRINSSCPSGWTVTATPKTGSPVNGYHPVVLQRPLAPLIRAKGERHRQRDAVYDALRPAIMAFLKGNEITALRDLLSNILDAH